MIQEKGKDFRKAVALIYDRERDNAPCIIAAGKGEIAEKMLSAAKEHHIPMHENAELVENLIKYEISTEIPAELYKAVAEVLAFVYELDNKVNKKNL